MKKQKLDQPRHTKNWILLFICQFLVMFFTLTTSVHAQAPSGGYECGVYKKITPDGFQPSQPAYVDRFGNQYSEDEMGLWNLNLQSNHCDQIEDFTLIFENNQNNPFSNDEMETICDVFDYLSGLIVAQSGERAVIRLSKDPSLGAGVGAVGTPFFPNQCGLGHSLVHQQLFTGGVNTPQHGLIAVNANISNFYIGPSAGIGPNQVDYYTVILHEALHVLGFGSQITPNGAPAQGFYTLWDLNIVNNDGEHMILSTMPSTNGGCCADYVFNSADFPGMPNLIWNQNCGPSNVKFDVAQLPPVNGEYASQDPQTFMNVLSHLDRTCGTEHYVMNSGIPPGLDGVQRTLTNAETAILCRLGYQTSGCTPDCIVIAENDGAFFVAQGQSITIDISTLIANDFPSNATFSLMTNCGNTSGIGITPNGSQIVIQGNDLGVYTFCYSITGCNGQRCDVATVRIVVTNPALAEACENLEECQINPFVDFEEFGSDEELRQLLTAGNNGFGFWEQPWGWDNTPDLVDSPDFGWTCNGNSAGVSTPSGNQFLRFVMRRYNDADQGEGVSLPLCEPVFPGMSGTVTFIATALNPCLIFGPNIRVEFSENAPIAGAVVYNNPGISSPSWFIPITSTPNTNPVFATYTVNFTNESNVCWNYLYLSSFTQNEMPFPVFGTIYVDAVRTEINNNLLDVLDVTTNIAPEEPCLGDQVNVTIEICNNVECDGNTFSNPATLVTAQLPPGLTLVPNADFSTLTHLISEGDIPPGGCIALTLTLQVSSDEVFDGQPLPINLQFNPLAPCFAGTTLSAGTVPPMICNPEFSCPCTGPNDLNIDAGDPSTNPNDPSVIPVSVSATAIPSSTISTFFSPNTLARPCIAIKGNLIIDNNYDLFILGGEIRMQPGAKIIVAPGATLRLGFINGGTGTEQGIHGCDQMWRSIEVRPGGSLYTGYNVVQDAEYAFDLRSSAGTTTTLTSYWNDFNRNHVGVRVNNTTTATISQPFQFAKNQFRATSTLVPKFSDDITNWNASAPYTGLSLANTTFFVGTQGDPGSDNEFNGLRNGILADRTTLNVYYARFLNTQGVLDHFTSNPNFANSQGIGIFARSCGTFNVRNSTFDGAPRAVHTQRSSLDIRNSLIQNVDAAIYNVPALFNRINVYDNDIYFRGAGVVVNGASTFTRVFIDRNDPIQAVPSSLNGKFAVWLINMPATSSQTKRVANNRISLQVPDAYGIYIGAAGGWKVQNNFVEYTNPSFFIDAGIALDNADNNYLKENEIRSTIAAGSNGKAGINLFNSENNTLCCNITDDLHTGLRFIGVNDDTKLRHSDIRDHVFGLHCGYPVAPGQPLPTAIIGDQLLAGNAWNGNYAFLGAVHNGNNQSVVGSQFFVELPQALPLWPNSPLSPAAPDQWFLPTGGNSSACITDASNCPVLPPPPYAPEDPRDLTENEKAIASGQYGGQGAYGLAAQFEGERSLYGKMKRNASLSGQDALVDQFFGGAHTSVIGRLYEIDSLTTDLGRMSEADWQQLNQLDNSIDSISGEITRIDSLYAFASTASDSLALQNQKKSLTNYLQPLQQAWQSLSDSLSQAQLARVPSVASLNNGIISNDLLVNNRKIVNRIFLETLALGNYTATETQLNDLLAVAVQCFLEGGDAVLWARALYSAFAQPLQIDDVAICGYQGEERSTKGAGMGASGNYEIKVMPNPAKDRVSFVVSGALPDATFFVQIFDLNGKIVKELNVRNGEVLTHAFSPGLYFCRAHMGEEPVQTVKFIIIP
jgi:hypothetical protein